MPPEKRICTLNDTPPTLPPFVPKSLRACLQCDLPLIKKLIIFFQLKRLADFASAQRARSSRSSGGETNCIFAFLDFYATEGGSTTSARYCPKLFRETFVGFV